MFVDPIAICALGTDCATHSDDLAVAAAALKSLPGPGSAAAFGPVGAGFLATFADAVGREVRAIVALSEELASANLAAGVVAETYADADRRGGRLL